jgi:hypothetical protein
MNGLKFWKTHLKSFFYLENLKTVFFVCYLVWKPKARNNMTWKSLEKKFDEKKLLSDMLWNDKYRASEEKTAKNDKNREKK